MDVRVRQELYLLHFPMSISVGVAVLGLTSAGKEVSVLGALPHPTFLPEKNKQLQGQYRLGYFCKASFSNLLHEVQCTLSFLLNYQAALVGKDCLFFP